MSSSVLTIEGNMSKNTLYASCCLTHLVRQRLNGIVFFSLGTSFSITSCKSSFRLGGFWNTPLGTPLLLGEEVVGHSKKGKNGCFAKTIFYFLKADEKGLSTAIVQERAVNLGDGKGMQVPFQSTV